MYNSFNGIPLYTYLVAFFSSIIQISMGSSFYVSSYHCLKRKSANMDVLIALGTTAAWGYGIVIIILGYNKKELMNHELYLLNI